jgi:uncharacterized Zn-finger protein
MDSWLGSGNIRIRVKMISCAGSGLEISRHPRIQWVMGDSGMHREDGGEVQQLKQ